MNNLNELYHEWETIKCKSISRAIDVTLPSYFLKTSSGDSLEKIAPEITNHLKELKLTEFSCDTKHYVFFLSVPPIDGDYFPSFKRLFSYYKHELSKFNITYKGVLFIDISEWIKNHTYNRTQFKDFLEFVNVIKDDAVVFFVSDCDWADNESAYSLIKKRIRIEKVEVRDDFTLMGVDYLKKLIKENDLTIEKRAEDKLTEVVTTILRVRGNRASEGIKDVFNEIIYRKLKNRLDPLKTINFNDIKDYLKGGKFEQDADNNNGSTSIL